MNTRKIRSLEKKCLKEAQMAVDIIFSRYSKLIVEDIKKQIPIGHSLNSWNGMVSLDDSNGNRKRYGNARSVTADEDIQFDYIAGLQYGTDANDLQGNFTIPQKITSNTK